MNRNVAAFMTVIVGMSLLVSSCATPVVGGGGTVGVNGYAWGMGKLTFTTSYNVMRCHDAAITALTELGVALTGDTTDMLAGGRIVGRTAVGNYVTVNLEPQARNNTKIDIRVGILGDEAQSRMIADAIKRRL